MWNIHGLKNEKVDTFRNYSETVVKKIFDENGIICFTETLHDRFDRDVLSQDDNFSEHTKMPVDSLKVVDPQVELHYLSKTNFNRMVTLKNKIQNM